MLLEVPGFPDARIEWHPAKSSNFTRGRNGQRIRGHVDHRMVGWLTGTRRYFTLTSDRPVSTHFGIGHDGIGDPCPTCGPITGAKGSLVVDQYVDLGDTAFGNGNSVPSASWPLVKLGLNENWITYSTEHEDGATAGRGAVTPHVWATSIALDRLLRLQSLDVIRQHGVQIGNRGWHAAARAVELDQQLKAIPIDATGYIDHHAIADYLKPYCFRRWLDDPGFVPARQADKLAALKGDDDVKVTFKISSATKAGTVRIEGNDHLFLRLLTGTLHPIAHGVEKRGVGPVELVGRGITGPSDPRKVGYVIEEEAAFVITADAKFTADAIADPKVVANETITQGQAALEALRPK